MRYLLRFFRLALPALALLLCAQVALAQANSEQRRVYDLLYGYMLAASGNYAQAAARIGEVGIARRDSTILASAVRLALQAQDIAQAEKYAEVWVKAGGGVPARQTMAELHIFKGNYAAAEQLLAGLMAEQAQTPESLFHQLRAVQDGSEALVMGRRLFPRDGEGYYYLALLALANGNGKMAEDISARAMAADPARLDILFLSARIAQQEHGDSAPLTLLREFASEGCAQAVRHCTLDAVLWAFSDYLRNGDKWQTALDAPRADAATWAVSAGNWYEQWEMTQAARDAYQRAGGAFMAQLGLARLAEAAGNPTAALDILMQAEVEDSNDLVRRETTIAYLLGEQGEWMRALQRVRRAQQTVPDNFSLMYHESLLLEKGGDVPGALAVLRRLTKIFPDNADGWNALGYVMADHNIELEEAKGYIERALSASPQDPNIMDSLGWVHYRMGNLARARMQLQKAAELSNSAEIHAHYGEVLWEMGDPGAAKRVWEQARGQHPDNELLNDTIKRYYQP